MPILEEYLRPATVDEAARLLAERSGRAVLLAGGTEIVGALALRRQPAIDTLIDVSRLGLGDIAVDGEMLRIGATATLTDLIAHEGAAAAAGGLLVRAAKGEGPVNVRNAATVGGVVATGATDSELYAALLALGAAVLQSGAPEPVLLEALEQVQGLITALLVPLGERRGGLARTARTPADRPIVAAVAVTGAEGSRVALCGVAERPILDGTPHTPYADFKGSADYRAALAAVLRARALAEAGNP